MLDLFDSLIDPLLDREGGYVNNPLDKGGATNFGITEQTARENGFTSGMRDMTRERAKAIYRAVYWTRPGFHLIAPLSRLIAAELLDTGVNMGVGVSSIFLQRCLNALNNQSRDYSDLRADGCIGPDTVSSLKDFLAVRGLEGERVMLKALNCLQGARYIELAEARPQNEAFLYGWLRARVSLPA